MERELSVAGDILLELREADELECTLEENSPRSITREFGGLVTLICC